MGRNFIFCFLLCMFIYATSNAQLIEDFSDGDFTHDPIWSGNTPDFIVNSLFQLQSNNTVANSGYFITTPNTLASVAQWEMDVHIAFNPSSANYIDAWLISSSADLAGNNNTGYFIRIGNTDDEISLYRKDAGGTIVKIIDGTDGVLDNSNNVIKIKVTRDGNNQWTLSRDLSGTRGLIMKMKEL